MAVNEMDKAVFESFLKHMVSKMDAYHAQYDPSKPFDVKVEIIKQFFHCEPFHIGKPFDELQFITNSQAPTELRIMEMVIKDARAKFAKENETHILENKRMVDGELSESLNGWVLKEGSAPALDYSGFRVVMKVPRIDATL